MSKFTFPKSQLKLSSTLEKHARTYAEQAGDEIDANRDPIDYLAEWHMESMSEAGYSETRPDDRRSVRAFVRLLNFQPADRKRVEDAVGAGRGCSEYRELGFATLITQVLSDSAEYAAGLKAAYCGDELGSKGPFGRSKTLYLLPHLDALGIEQHQRKPGNLPTCVLNFEAICLGHLAFKYANVTEIESDEQKALVNFASIIRVGDIDALVKKLRKRGLKNEAGLTLAVADAIIGALRVNRVYACGIKYAQYSPQ